jgi:hypothetical protein
VSKTIAITQSNYIPWKGYFDVINSVDEFVLYDDVQYTRRDWRNRNQIKTPDGPLWLTIPVQVKGKFSQPIKDVRVSDRSWAQTHWRAIVQNYARTPYFAEYREVFERAYLTLDTDFLSEINYRFLVTVCSILGIRTPITWSMDYRLEPGRTERLVSICKQAGARHYVSGPAAQAYLDETLFHAEGIEVWWADYQGYPEYRQRFPPFEHTVSILDLLFNEGPQARHYLKSFLYGPIHRHNPVPLGWTPRGVLSENLPGRREDHA